MFGQVASAAIKIYGIFLSPVLAGLGCRCRFHPSCSEYAAEAFMRHSAGSALRLTLLRVLKCGPWHTGGIDTVPLTKGAK